MSFQKYKINSYCVAQKHYSGTKNVVGEITFNKKNGKEMKLLFGQSSIWNRKKSMIVSDNTVQAESFGDFVKNSGEKGLKVAKNMAKHVLKKPGRALNIIATFVTAAAS